MIDRDLPVVLNTRMLGVRVILDLNTNWLFTQFQKINKGNKTKLRKDKISINRVFVTVLFNILSGYWKVAHIPTDTKPDSWWSIMRNPHDSLIANYINIVPSYIEDFINTSRRLEDAIDTKDFNTAKLLLNAVNHKIHNCVTGIPPDVSKLMEVMPDNSKYFTKKQHKGDPSKYKAIYLKSISSFSDRELMPLKNYIKYRDGRPFAKPAPAKIVDKYIPSILKGSVDKYVNEE